MVVSRSLTVVVMAFGLALVSVGCGPLTYSVRGNQRATGADAVITADVNKETSVTTVNILVENLPPPDRVDSSAAHYVAWQRADDKAPWTRIGALQYDEDGRSGRLEGVTVPAQHFDLEVSAEKSNDAASPSAAVIFSQRIN